MINIFPHWHLLGLYFILQLPLEFFLQDLNCQTLDMKGGQNVSTSLFEFCVL